MAAGQQFSRVVQDSFAGGMYRGGDPALMPANAFYDGQNALLDRLGQLYRRGGSSYRSTAPFGAGIRFLWDGALATGNRTLIASPSEYGQLETNGSVTALAHGGLSAPARPASFQGKLYLPGGVVWDGTTFSAATIAAAHYAVAGNRLVAAEGRTVTLTEPGKLTYAEAEAKRTEYIELPEGVEIIGLVGMRESVAVFTTGGIYIISGVANKIVDASGNVQWRVDRYSGTVLWGQGAGAIAQWESSLIVPATDHIWLVRRGTSSEAFQSFTRLTGPIVELYQEYVRLGYKPGQATVFANCYLLPILGGAGVRDLLVGRLDLEQKDGSIPWTHLTGFGAELGAVLTKIAPSSGETQLLGGTYGSSARVLNLAYFSPGEGTTNDADGSVAAFALETRSFPTGNLVPNLVSRMRLRYLLSGEGAPTIKASIATDTPTAGAALWGKAIWGAFAWGSPGAPSYLSLQGEAPVSIDASTPYSWRPRLKRRLIRMRLTCTQATIGLSIKSLELFVRASGRL